MEYIEQIRYRSSSQELPLSEFDIKVVLDEKKGVTVHHLYRNGIHIKKHNKLEVSYKCRACLRLNIVAMSNMLKKFNKGIFNCVSCREGCGDEGTITKLITDQECFDRMDHDFKNDYFRHHMDAEEFERLSKKIVSFHHDKFPMDLERFVYCPCVRVQNQTHFAPFVYDKQRDVLEKVVYIKYLCDHCGVCFENKELFQQKNKHKALCKDCCFTNNVAKIKTEACCGVTVQYKTKFDVKFIRWCNKNNVIIGNGPEVSYTSPDGSPKTSRITFSVPHKDIWLEFKSQRLWHDRHEIAKSAREQAAEAFASSLGKTYMLIYPCMYVQFCKSLLKFDKI